MSAAKRRVSSSELTAQKTEADARLDAIRQEQVDALEEGRDFKHNDEVVLLTERLAALDKAISRAAKREEVEREKALRASERRRLIAIKAKLEAQEAERLQALNEADEAATALIRAMQRFYELSDDVYSTIQQTRNIFVRHGVQPDEPVEYFPPNIDGRLGTYLSGTFNRLGRLGNSIGTVQWANQQHPGHLPWADIEGRALKSRIRGVVLRDLDRLLLTLPELPTNEA